MKFTDVYKKKHFYCVKKLGLDVTWCERHISDYEDKHRFDNIDSAMLTVIYPSEYKGICKNCFARIRESINGCYYEDCQEKKEKE